MISYVTIGTNNMEKALEFYDALLPAVGGQRAFEAPKGQFYSFAQGTMLGILRPDDGQAATGGNGTMFAFKVESQLQVDAVYGQAIELGATDAGEPGPRGERGFYGAYFRDFDGNKLCVYIM